MLVTKSFLFNDQRKSRECLLMNQSPLGKPVLYYPIKWLEEGFHFVIFSTAWNHSASQNILYWILLIVRKLIADCVTCTLRFQSSFSCQMNYPPLWVLSNCLFENTCYNNIYFSSEPQYNLERLLFFPSIKHFSLPYGLIYNPEHK